MEIGTISREQRWIEGNGCDYKALYLQFDEGFIFFNNGYDHTRIYYSELPNTSLAISKQEVKY